MHCLQVFVFASSPRAVMKKDFNSPASFHFTFIVFVKTVRTLQSLDMSSIGRGRGRPRNAETAFPLGSPLRRPYQVDDDTLTRKLENLKFLREDDDETAALNDVITHIKSRLQSEAAVDQITSTLHKYSADNRNIAKHVALIYHNLSELSIGDTKIRTVLFKRLQQDFLEKDVLVKDKGKFLNLVALVCEVFHLLRAPNGIVFEFLCKPVIEYLKILLQGSSDNEIETVVQQFLKNGKDLQKHAEKEFEDLRIKIRERIISDAPLTSASRKGLLFCLEYSLTGWRDLPPEIQKVYN